MSLKQQKPKTKKVPKSTKPTPPKSARSKPKPKPSAALAGLLLLLAFVLGIGTPPAEAATYHYYKTVSATTTNTTVTFAAGPAIQVDIINDGADNVWINFGAAAVTDGSDTTSVKLGACEYHRFVFPLGKAPASVGVKAGSTTATVRVTGYYHLQGQEWPVDEYRHEMAPSCTTSTGGTPTFTSVTTSGALQFGTTLNGPGAADAANNIQLSSAGITFEGATTGANETVLYVTDPTADTTWNIPALGAAGSPYQFVGASAALTATRVPFADANLVLTDAAGLTWASNTLTATNAQVTTALNVPGAADAANNIQLSSAGITFEGSTTGANETVLGVVDPTADATINLPALGAAGSPYLVTVSAAALTATRIPYVDANLALVDDSAFFYTAGTDTVTMDKLAISTSLSFPADSVQRADLIEDALQVFEIPINELRTAAYAALTVGTTDGADALADVVLSTNAITINGDPADNETETQTFMFFVRIPQNYVSAGDVKLRFRSALIESGAAATDNGSSIDAACYEQTNGAVGADIVSDAAQTFAATDTWEDNDLALTAAGLVAGDLLSCTVTLSTIENNAGAETITLKTHPPVLLVDVKG